MRMRGSQPWIVNRSQILRANSTAAERKLWHALRNRQLVGLKFVRQVAIGPYFADFLCRELKLVVEVDGATHSTDEEIARDQARTRSLESAGYHVVRVRNLDVTRNLDGVLLTLMQVAEQRRI